MSEISRYQWGEPIGELSEELVYGGDCAGGMPAVYVTRVEETYGRYAETEEEWRLFGAHLPAEVTVITDMEIGCENYQKLLAAGMAIEDCTACPLRTSAEIK